MISREARLDRVGRVFWRALDGDRVLSLRPCRKLRDAVEAGIVTPQPGDRVLFVTYDGDDARGVALRVERP